MFNRHVTHLIARYTAGQLRPAQRAQVVNHVRVCDSCRAALAREERLAAELRREMPWLGQPDPARIDRVWVSVWQDIQSTRRPARRHRSAHLPGLSMALAILVTIALALPLLAQRGMRAEAAPFEPGAALVRSTASPTPGGTGEALESAPTSALAGSQASAEPQTTVALLPAVGASPAPMPVSTAWPDAPTDAAPR